MLERRAYAGPVEALTMEEAASRLRIGLDLFRKRYTGPLVKIGANVRVSASDLQAWLDDNSTATVQGDSWAGVGDDAEESALPARKQSALAR